MYYQIQHITRFRYSQTISESIMEIRMQPRTEGVQRCLRFMLATNPQARVLNYADHLGNIVHFFDIPSRHGQLIMQAEALVELLPPPTLPESSSSLTWEAINTAVAAHDYWDYLVSSERVAQTEALQDFAQEIDVHRGTDPLTVLRGINTGIYQAFAYKPDSTEVDSPIDIALQAREGVCQDFAHIMLALVRGLGIPARYVSGYLYYQRKTDRSTPDASHAWVEVLLPQYGWVGFDPTNNLMATDRHIRVAIGRDYTDVPPNKGVFKGIAESSLEVEVRIVPAEMDSPIEELLPVTSWTLDPLPPLADQQQAQQQQ